MSLIEIDISVISKSSVNVTKDEGEKKNQLFL